MLKLRKMKWITGLLFLALAGGVMVTTTACGAGESEIVSDKEEERESAQGTEGSGRDEPEKTGGSQESAGQPSESAEQDYSELAARINEDAVTFLEALKAGDIETLLSMTDPESMIYGELSDIKEYETGKEFIHTLYESTVYKCLEDNNTEYRLTDACEQGEDEFYLDMYIGIPNTIYFMQYLTVPGVVFQDGEQIPEGYEVESNEEALQIVRSVAERLPVMDTSITVQLQEDGGFYFEVGPGPFSCMNSSDFKSGENFLIDFLSEKISDGVIVGQSDGLYEEYPEEWTQMLSLVKQKDFDGLLALANGEPDKYIKKSFSQQTPYRTPEELTEAQRAFYNRYVEQIEVYASEKVYVKMQECLNAVMVVAPAISLNDQEMEWYTENGIKEYRIEHRFGKGGADGLIDAMSTLLSLIEDGIEYAEKKY
ncbi:MAG: hypothetical protein K2O34_06485 [Acetatifactor sp.]|nr:hypothetical protein [Acetatifactor sp.]